MQLTESPVSPASASLKNAQSSMSCNSTHAGQLTQMHLDNYSSSPKSKFPLTSQKSRNITVAIAGFLACDMRPFSTVENIGFTNLVGILEPNFEMPSRTHIAQKVMPELYTKVKKRILTDSNNADFIAVTTDGWTSRAAQGYITITAHYIDDNFEIQNHTLQTRQLNSSHIDENLAEVLTNAVEEWGLKKSQPVAITTDNASNIVSGISNISSVFPPTLGVSHIH